MCETVSCSHERWRELFPQISDIDDFEKLYKETMIHKEYVIKSCEKLARYLERNGAKNHAKLLRKRAVVHDDSKLTNKLEMLALSKIINDQESLKDPAKRLAPENQKYLKLHWKNNSHHPEHFESVMDMTKLDIMEMCCDWYARSMQYGSDFLNFVKKRQDERFHFPDWMFAEIWHYCEVLNSEEEED